MIINYSELIDRFGESLGTPKELIRATFNKPDAAENVMGRFIAVKEFSEFYMLVIYEVDGLTVRFLNAYRIYPQLLRGFVVHGSRPSDILREFMKNYGVVKGVQGMGNYRFLVDRKNNVLFLGILDVEKYMNDVNALFQQVV